MSFRIAVIRRLLEKNRNKVVKKYKNKSPLLFKTTGEGQHQASEKMLSSAAIKEKKYTDKNNLSHMNNNLNVSICSLYASRRNRYLPRK